jgi:hypothetical protein
MKHFTTYLRLLDANAEGADWAEAARSILHLDPSDEPARAWRAWETHLARAKWLTERGYRTAVPERVSRTGEPRSLGTGSLLG